MPVPHGELFYRSSREVFNALIKAGITLHDERHPKYASLQRVTFPEGVRLTEHSSDCALLLVNDGEIARVYFKDGRWVMYNPHSTSSPHNRARAQGSSGGGFVDGVLDVIEGIGDAIEDATDRVIRGFDDIF
jgi:hypothetical protein